MSIDISDVIDVTMELQDIQNKVQEKIAAIEVGVDDLENNQKARDVRKKEIVLKEMKKVLAMLSETDANITKNMKSEAFDLLRSMNKVSYEATDLLKQLTDDNNKDNDQLKSNVKSLKDELESLGMDEFLSNLEMSVAVQQGGITSALDLIADPVFLHSSVLNAKQLFLEIPERLPSSQPSHHDPNYVYIKIFSLTDNFSFTPMVLKNLMIHVSCQAPGGGRKVLEESSAWTKLEKSKAKISEDGGHVVVQLKRPSNVFALISIKVLESNITNSPIVHQFHPHHEIRELEANNETLGNETIGIFDATATWVDKSINQEVANRRREVLRGVGKQQFSALSDLQSKGRVLKQAEIANGKPSHLNNTTPFSPYSEGAVSTMRASVATSQISNVLSKLAVSGVEKSDGHEQNTSPTLEQPVSNYQSAVALSSSDGMSIDDMQRSLSGGESEVDKSYVNGNLDKSVSFAQRTQVVEVVATPQIRPNNIDARFRVYQGQTKRKDGQAGIAKRKTIIDVTDEDLNEEGNFLANAETLPIVEPYLSIPSYELIDGEDPHLMLNASKAPSPLKKWMKEDSIWDEASDIDQDDEFDENPHILLNASKAPPSGADWPTMDAAWHCNTSILPDAAVLNKSLVPQSNKDMNVTIWGEDLNEKTQFDFLRESLEVVEIYKSHPVTRSSSRGSQFCLESPCYITFMPEYESFLVSEPEHNRVGMYDVQFQFKYWMLYPRQGVEGRSFYNYPTSILALSNGFLVLLEKDRLHVFDDKFMHVQCLKGVFHGLTEGPEGEILALTANSNKEIFVKKIVFEETESLGPYLKTAGKKKVSVIQNFENWEVLSKPRFLTFCRGKVIITDLGLHKIYMVDLATGEQTATGYMGSKLGQFTRPTGLVADDSGNVLVGDSENNRLVVANKEGQVVRVVDGQGQYFYPHDMIRVDDTVLVVYMGGVEANHGAIVRYRMNESEPVSN